MKRKLFSEEQIIEILRQHQAGAKPADLCRQHGISETTLYNWRSRYRRDAGVGRQAAAVAGRREPQAEEAAGRGDAGQRSLEGHRLGKVLKPAVRRRAVDHVRRCPRVEPAPGLRADRLDGCEQLSVPVAASRR